MSYQLTQQLLKKEGLQGEISGGKGLARHFQSKGFLSDVVGGLSDSGEDDSDDDGDDYKITLENSGEDDSDDDGDDYKITLEDHDEDDSDDYKDDYKITSDSGEDNSDDDESPFVLNNLPMSKLTISDTILGDDDIYF